MRPEEVIGLHTAVEYVGDGVWWCNCGTVYNGQHVLDALKAAGYAVVELPEVEPRGIIGQVQWPAGGHFNGNVTITHEGRILSDAVGNPCDSPQDARDHAAALLAAANAAEGLS